MPTTYTTTNGGVQIGGDSTVTFTSGVGQVPADCTFEWDFDNDGDFDESVEDITAYVLDAQMRVGRDKPSLIEGRAQPGTLRLTLDNQDNRFSYFNTESPLTTSPFSLKTGRKFRVRRSGDCAVLDLTGASGAYANTPDASAWDITGDISIWVDVSLDDWTSGSAQTLLSKWLATGNQRSYMFQVSSTGFPRIFWSPDGTLANQRSAVSTAVVPVDDGARVILGVQLDVDNGAAGVTARFYYKLSPAAVFWTQLGDAVTAATTTSIHSGTALPAVGAIDAGTGERATGTVYEAEVRSGLAGTSYFSPSSSTTLVDRVVFKDQTVGASSFASDTSKTWTIQGAASLADGNCYVNPDPVLLVRDRFQRGNDDDFIGYAEYTADGISATYDEPRANDFVIENETVVTPFSSVGNQVMAIIDVGQTDYVAQIRVRDMGANTDGATSSYGGIVYRYQDGNNYSAFRMFDGSTSGSDRFELVDVVAGVETVIQSTTTDFVDDTTLSVWVHGNVVMAFREGIALMTDTAIQLDETGVGFYGFWGAGNAGPIFDDFFVWDRMGEYSVSHATEQSGVLGTFEVRRVRPASAPTRASRVVVECEGYLAKLANQDIAPPRFRVQQFPGRTIGKALAAGLAIHPLASFNAIDLGVRRTCPVTSDEDKVKLLEFVRPFEAHEIGFLWERPEGGIAFDQRTARDALTAQSGLSDAGGFLTYEHIELLDRRDEIVNRIEFGFSGQEWTTSGFAGGGVSSATAAGVANSVTTTLPTDIGNGDLVIFVVTSAVADTVDTHVEPPIWWVAERRKLGTLVRQRVFTHISDGTDGGSTVTFQSDTTPVGGSWVGYQIVIAADSWFGTHEGIAMGKHGGPTQPPFLELPWGSQPTLVVAMRGAMRGTGISVSGPVMPVGFFQLQSTFENGVSTNLDDAAQQLGWATTVEPVVVTGAFGGTFSGGGEVESALLAIRGYAGANPQRSGVTLGRYNDKQSQVDYNIVRSLPAASQLYGYNDTDLARDDAELIFDNFAQDRPHLKVRFTATKNAAYRELATRRRLTEKVKITANNNAQFGVVSGVYHIEAITMNWSQGNTLWTVEWELSPELV